MIRYDSLWLECDNVFTVFRDCECRLRNGCSQCCGTGEVPEVADLTTVLRNLAIAGALCAAFGHGEIKGYDDTDEGWQPGCGQPAPAILVC